MVRALFCLLFFAMRACKGGMRDAFVALGRDIAASSSECTGEALSKELFSAHTELFMRYPQTCYLLVHGRMRIEDVLRQIDDGGDPHAVVRSHWEVFARDTALASPSQFESVLQHTLQHTTKLSPKEVEDVARKAQLKVLVDASSQDFELAMKSVEGTAADFAFRVAHSIRNSKREFEGRPSNGDALNPYSVEQI